MSESSAPEPEKIFNAPPGWHISGINNGSVYTRVGGYSRKNLKGVPADGLTPKHLSALEESNTTAERIDPVGWSNNNGLTGVLTSHPPFYQKYGENLKKLSAIVEVCMRYMELNGKKVKFVPNFSRMGYYEYDDPSCSKWVVRTSTGHVEVFRKRMMKGQTITDKDGVSKGVINYVNCAKKHHAKNSQHYYGKAFDRIIEINGSFDAEIMYAHAARLVLSGFLPDGGMGYYEEQNKSKASDFHYDFGSKRKWFWAGNGAGNKKLIIGSNGVSNGNWDEFLEIAGKSHDKGTVTTLEWWVDNVLPPRVRKNIDVLPDPKSYGSALPTWEEIYNGTTEDWSEEPVYLFVEKDHDVRSMYDLPPATAPPTKALVKLKRRILHKVAREHNKVFYLLSESSQEFLDTMNGLEAQGIFSVADTNYNIDDGTYQVLVSIKKKEWDALPEFSPGFLASGLFIEIPFGNTQETVDTLVKRIELVKEKMDKDDSIESWDGDLDKAISDLKKFPSVVKNSILPALEPYMESAGYYNKTSASDSEEDSSQAQTRGPLAEGTAFVLGIGLSEDDQNYDIKFVGADTSPWQSLDGQRRMDTPPVFSESSGDLAGIKSDPSLSTTSLNFLAFHDLIASFSSPDVDWVQFLEDYYTPETRIVWKPVDRGEVPGLKTDGDVAKEDRDLHRVRVEIAKEGIA